MLGQSVLVDKPMETGDEISGVCFASKSVNRRREEVVVAFNSKYHRVFGRRGEHLGGDSFPIDVPGEEVVKMRFFGDVGRFAAVHCSGSQVRKDDTSL